MDKEYRKLIEDIIIQNEKYTNSKMAGVYLVQKTQLDSLNKLLGELFIKYGNIGLLKMNASQKADTGIKTLLKNMGATLAKDEVEKVTSIISTVYKDTYYKNAFIMDSGLKVDLKFDILKKEFVDAAVNQKFKGELFSDRIWTNKADMIDKLQSSLIKCMNGETTIDKIGKDIRDTFNVTAYESQRLINTENARVQTQASYDIGISSGVSQVMWSSTLDDKTNEEDASLDGQVWGIDEEHPEPPLHPFADAVLSMFPLMGGHRQREKIILQVM